MKVGDKYKCIKNYFFSYVCYFIENRTYTIREIKKFEDTDEDIAVFEHNDGTDEDMFMDEEEMTIYFVEVPGFKFGK